MARNPRTRAGTRPRPQCFIARTIAYPPSMAKPPWARLTKPIKPMVTERPTDTMNSTVPAATPPRTMPATSVPKITSSAVGSGTDSTPPPPPAGAERPPWSCRRTGGAVPRSVGGARPDLLFLAGVLHGVDLANHLLEEAAVLHHRLGQILVHDDVASIGIDLDRAPRAVEFPALERGQRLVGVNLALEHLDDVDDRGHAVVAADGKEV